MDFYQDEPQNDQIPQNVLTALKAINDNNATNMLDRRFVVALVDELDHEAAVWLEKHRSRYMDALSEMGSMEDAS